MNLLNEIEAAQRKAKVTIGAFGGRNCRFVFEAMTREAQKAWRDTNLPEELLASRQLSDIKVYADACGIKLPDDPISPASPQHGR